MIVNEASGFHVLSFLDAYSGYNQIRMHDLDEEKMTFIIEDATFCYRVMAFILKNAGATYYRLMDQMFKQLIKHKIKVYVDKLYLSKSLRSKRPNSLLIEKNISFGRGFVKISAS